MGDESGIGARTILPNNTIIGNHVIISRDCLIWPQNHRFDRTDIPINDQGMLPPKQTIIEDDVWIGLRIILTPGRHVERYNCWNGFCFIERHSTILYSWRCPSEAYPQQISG